MTLNRKIANFRGHYVSHERKFRGHLKKSRAKSPFYIEGQGKPCFVKIGPPVPEKKIFEVFFHIWVWRPSWSYYPDAANKLFFPLPKVAPHKIWL